jgi:hypothetical protein
MVINTILAQPIVVRRTSYGNRIPLRFEAMPAPGMVNVPAHLRQQPSAPIDLQQ